MFKLNRTTDENENEIKLSTRKGKLKIIGTSDFVTTLFKDLVENSELFREEFRRVLSGETHATIAAKMRAVGFPESIVRDFEDGIIWDDLIDA
jgi:hypothetical protein